MSFSWQSVGSKLAKHGLNLLSSAIPAGGFITNVIADILNVSNDPESIDKAVEKMSIEDIERLKKVEQDHKTELLKITMQNETARLAEINRTMRYEAKSDKWYVAGWRPFWGFSSATAFVAICVFIGYLALRAVKEQDANAMALIPQMISTLTTLFAVPGAILGISAWHRGKEKIEKLKVGL